tara:strand:- start:4046 stop:4651 length:606 start_codon:yes stop_codon:yes gene_type:complete
MALLKPKQTERTDTSKYFGVCPLAIVNFEDRSDKYDWADILLDAEVQVKDSDYTKKLTIKGTFDRDDAGKIAGGSVLNRLYKFFTAIGCTAGINTEGNWETDDGEPIKKIDDYLKDNHLSSVIPGTDPTFEYVGYIYKEQNKNNKQVYTRVYHRLWPNTDKGKEELESHVTWMKEKGYLKEYTGPSSNGTAEVSKEAMLNL